MDGLSNLAYMMQRPKSSNICHIFEHGKGQMMIEQLNKQGVLTDGGITELSATPGRKIAEYDRLFQQWDVSMHAGAAVKAGRASIPIASFFGPNDREDAQLFAAAAPLYEMVKAQDMLLDVIDEFVGKATDGKIEVGKQDIVRRVRFAARLTCMLACGVELVEFCGYELGGVAFHARKMPIREALLWIDTESNVMTEMRSAARTPEPVEIMKPDASAEAV